MRNYDVYMGYFISLFMPYFFIFPLIIGDAFWQKTVSYVSH